MPSQSRKYRGYETQRLVAQWFAEHGWPYAESAGAGRPGSDVTGMIGIDVEVKATSSFEPLSWLKQMRLRARKYDVSFGVWRPNGHGPADISEWPVITDLATMTFLVQHFMDVEGDK